MWLSFQLSFTDTNFTTKLTLLKQLRLVWPEILFIFFKCLFFSARGMCIMYYFIIFLPQSLLFFSLLHFSPPIRRRKKQPRDERLEHSTNNTQLVFTAHTLNLIYFVSFSWSLFFFQLHSIVSSLSSLLLLSYCWPWYFNRHRVAFHDVCALKAKSIPSSSDEAFWVEDETVRQRTNNLDQITINERWSEWPSSSIFQYISPLSLATSTTASAFFSLSASNNVAMKSFTFAEESIFHIFFVFSTSVFQYFFKFFLVDFLVFSLIFQDFFSSFFFFIKSIIFFSFFHFITNT